MLSPRVVRQVNAGGKRMNTKYLIMGVTGYYETGSSPVLNLCPSQSPYSDLDLRSTRLPKIFGVSLVLPAVT